MIVILQNLRKELGVQSPTSKLFHENTMVAVVACFNSLQVKIVQPVLNLHFTEYHLKNRTLLSFCGAGSSFFSEIPSAHFFFSNDSFWLFWTLLDVWYPVPSCLSYNLSLAWRSFSWKVKRQINNIQLNSLIQCKP